MKSRNLVERFLCLLSLCCFVFEPSVTSLSSNLDDDCFCFAVFDEPLTRTEALRSPEAPHWLEAMLEEEGGFMLNKSWIVYDIPFGCNLMKAKWVFKKKKNKKGEVERYRARIVIKGFTQKAGVDYNEIFAPVIRHSTLRLVLALCAFYGLFKRHLDLPKAFTQADMDND